MKFAKSILTTLVAVTAAFQPLTAVTGSAQVHINAENTAKTLTKDELINDMSFLYDEEDSVYYLGVGLRNIYFKVPTECNGRKIGKLDLGHVYFAEKYIPSDTDRVIIIVPDGVEVVNKHWNCNDTGIPFIELVYASGEVEDIKADDYEKVAEYLRSYYRSYHNEITDEELARKLMGYSINERNNIPYPITDKPAYEVKNETEYIVYTGEDGLTYLKVFIGTNGEKLIIPEEYNGVKIDRLNLKDIIKPSWLREGYYHDCVMFTLPDSIALSDTHWVDKDTGIGDIYITDSTGNETMYNSERYAPDNFRTTNSCDKWDVHYPHIALDWISYSLGGKNMSDKDHAYLYELTLKVPENAEVVYDHWEAQKTHILKIKLEYPSGKTENYTADDYNYYQVESGNFKEYNAAIGYYIWDSDLEEYGNYYRGSDTAWIVFAADTPDLATHLEGMDKLFLSDMINDYDSETIEIEECVIPDNIKDLKIKYTAFDQADIGKLVLPSCFLNFDPITFKSSRIKEIVFSGDVTLPAMAFYGNQFLENVTFKGKAELDNTSFWKCEKLKNINISPDVFPAGVSFNQCRDLMTINGESPVNDDGSIKPEYEKIFKEKLYNTDGIGFVNKYVDYSVKKAVSEAVTDDMSDMEKVKALHDKLCSMTRYDHGNTEATKNHVDVSVFLNDSTVCEGYARAMNLMLHEAGVESCYVDTDTHAWVIVKLGNHYFHVDPTWDDNDEDITTYNWFMKADSEIRDDPSHSNWKMRCPSVMHNFQWEKMPACEEKMGDVNSDDIVDGRDATDILTAYAKSSAGGENSVDTIIADYDYNGIIDARDASAVLTAYAKASVENK